MMVFVVTLLFILIILVYTLHRYFSRNFDYWEKRGLKGPKPWPIFGDVLKNYFSGCTHKYYQTNAALYGNVYGSFAFTYPVLNVADPQLVKKILVKDFDKFVNRIGFTFGNEISDSMLPFAAEEIWRKIRIKISPTFSTGKMKKMYPIIQCCCKQSGEELEKLILINPEIDVKTVYGNYILDIITKVAFAVDTNCDPNFKQQLEVNARAVFDPPWYRIILILLCKKLASKNYEFLNPEVNFFVRFVEKMINQRSSDSQCEKRVDYLQLLLDDEMDSECSVNEDIAHLNIESEGLLQNSYKDQKLTKVEIIANCVMFLIVGYHTVTHSLLFVSYLLSINVDKQRLLYEEVIKYANEDGTVNYETLMKMQYLDAVICETLRLMPPATHLSRSATKDYKFEDDFNDFLLPKGTTIQIHTYTLHHNSQYFPEPENFIPERFLPENRENIVPYSYLPFGAGPRNCVGMRFALMEIKVAICSLIRKYEIVKCENTPIPLEVNNFEGLLKPQNLYLKFKKRGN